MDDTFTVEWIGHAWWVLSDGEKVAGPYKHQDYAEDRADTLKRAAKRKKRPCMCCGKVFLSEGPHNRLCDECRQIGATAEFVAV